MTRSLMSLLLFPGKVPWKKPPEKSSNQLDQWFDALFPLFLGGPFRWILTADKNFLDEETRLTAFPAKKTAALIYLPSKLNPGTIYTEKELTAILTSGTPLADPRRCAGNGIKPVFWTGETAGNGCFQN